MAEKTEKKDQAQMLKAMFQGNIQRVFVAGLAVVLLIRLLVFMMESNYAAREPIKPEEVSKLNQAITTTSPFYINVQKMIKPWPKYDRSEFWILAKYNMFDPKQITEAARIEQDATRIFDQAAADFNAGNLSQALERVDQALMRLPSHVRAQELKAKILAQVKKAEDAKTSKTLQAGGAAPPKTP